jgi:hypothetical protein
VPDGGAQPSKFIQQPVQGLSLAHLDVPHHVEGFKRPALAVLQDQPGAGHPIRLFTMDQVAHHIADGPCSLALIAVSPGVGKIPQKRA